jgi:hypothetical protein
MKGWEDKEEQEVSHQGKRSKKERIIKVGDVPDSKDLEMEFVRDGPCLSYQYRGIVLYVPFHWCRLMHILGH